MAKEKDIVIANHHTAPIILPRVYAPNVSGDPAKMTKMLETVTIAPGHSVVLTATEWEIRKKSTAIQYYMEHGHLEQVKRAGQVAVDIGATTELEIPEHLQVDQDKAVSVQSTADPNTTVKAAIRKQSASSVTVDA